MGLRAALVEQLCEIDGRVYQPGDVIDLEEVSAEYQAEHGMVTLDMMRILAAQPQPTPKTYITRDMVAQPQVIPVVVIHASEPDPEPPQPVEKPKRRRGRPRKATA